MRVLLVVFAVEDEVPTVRAFRVLKVEAIDAIEIPRAVFKEFTFWINDDCRPARAGEPAQVVHQEHRFARARRPKKTSEPSAVSGVMMKRKGFRKARGSFPSSNSPPL